MQAVDRKIDRYIFVDVFIVGVQFFYVRYSLGNIVLRAFEDWKEEKLCKMIRGRPLNFDFFFVKMAVTC